MHGRLRAAPGAVGARRRARRLQRQAARPRLAALRADHGRRDPACPGHGRRGRQPDDQRPRGVHPGQRVHPRRERRPRVLRRGRLLRARDRRRRRHRAPDGAPGSSRASPSSTSGRWTSGGSGRPTARRPTRWPARSRSTRPTTTSTTPNEERQAGRPLRTAPTYEMLSRARRRLRREVRLGAPELVRIERGGRRRGAPAAWLGGPALVAGHRRRGAGDPPGGGPVRRDLVRQARGQRAGCRRVPRSASCANDIDRAVGSIVYTQLLDRRGGIQADLTVTRLADDTFMLVTGTAFGNHDAAWLRRHLPDDGTVDAPRRHLVAGLLRAVGPAGPRHPRAAHARRPLERGRSRILTAREITIGAVPLLALRVTYVGELGWELYAPTEYGRDALDDALGRRRAARDGRRGLPGDRRAPAREGLPRLVERHHPGREPVRGGSRLRGRARQGRAGSSVARRSSRRRRPARASACAASSSTTRARSASATSRSGSTGEVVGPGHVGRLRLRRRALDRVRVPAADRRRSARAARSRSSVSGSGSRSRASRSGTRRGERIRS